MEIYKADFQSMRSDTRSVTIQRSKPHRNSLKPQLQTDGLQESILGLFFPNLLSFSEEGEGGTRRPFSAAEPPSVSVSTHTNS
jgi:hypothetical protein